MEEGLAGEEAGAGEINYSSRVSEDEEMRERINIKKYCTADIFYDKLLMTKMKCPKGRIVETIIRIIDTNLLI